MNKKLKLTLTTGIILFFIIYDIITRGTITLIGKILCFLQLKHSYKIDNSGISPKLLLMDMKYSTCIYCNRFKVEHKMPVPNSYIKELLLQKTLHERLINKKYVLVEKLYH